VRFEFLELPGDGGQAITRPVVPVQVGDLEQAPQLCLIDTGSLRNRFAFWLADACGVDLTGAPRTELAIGGFVTTGYDGRIDLTVGDERFDAAVSFCDPWPLAFNLLGQEGFLRAFRLTMSARESWLELERE
jgi:hypothetical protein